MGKKKAAKKKGSGAGAAPSTFGEALRAGPGFDLSALSTRATPGFTGKKKHGQKALQAGLDELSTLQEKLFAKGRTSDAAPRVLLVVQGMDTSGKGGIMRHVVGAVDPQGVAITAFKAPTAEERSHPFLWRIRKALPEPGMIGVFDRSHYEDVLIVRVHDLVPPAHWKRRYRTINDFEQGLVDDGVSVIKVMLHLSADEQKARLTERLDRPEKHWKFNPGDIDERVHWEDYQEAYQAAIDKCSTEAAPWHVVPADRKWYARLAVQQLLLEHLRALELTWPVADFDVEAERARLTDS